MGYLQTLLVDVRNIPQFRQSRNLGPQNRNGRLITFETIETIFEERNRDVRLGDDSGIDRFRTDIGHLETTVATCSQKLETVVD